MLGLTGSEETQVRSETGPGVETEVGIGGDNKFYKSCQGATKLSQIRRIWQVSLARHLLIAVSLSPPALPGTAGFLIQPSARGGSWAGNVYWPVRGQHGAGSPNLGIRSTWLRVAELDPCCKLAARNSQSSLFFHFRSVAVLSRLHTSHRTRTSSVSRLLATLPHPLGRPCWTKRPLPPATATARPTTSHHVRPL
jgi:hypothetical protein